MYQLIILARLVKLPPAFMLWWNIQYIPAAISAASH